MENKTKHGLGRGLDALFGDDFEEFDIKKLTDDEKNSVKEIALSKIEPCPIQPRQTFDEQSLDELTQSVKEKGVLQPLLVRPKNGKFEIVAGERRFRAALAAGLQSVPVIEKDLSDAEAFEVALIENIIRQNLTPIEEASGFEKMINQYQYTHDALSKSVGRSRSYISNALRLLELPQSVQDMVTQGKISASHARTLVGLKDAENLALHIISKDLNVRQTENLVKRAKEHTWPKKPKKENKAITEIEQNLEKIYGVKTRMIFSPTGRGRIILTYTNYTELENLLFKLENKEFKK